MTHIILLTTLTQSPTANPPCLATSKDTANLFGNDHQVHLKNKRQMTVEKILSNTLNNLHIRMQFYLVKIGRHSNTYFVYWTIGNIFVKFEAKYNKFRIIKWIRRCWLQTGGHFSRLQYVDTLRSRQMGAISQTTFSNAFSSMKMFEFRLKFHSVSSQGSN